MLQFQREKTLKMKICAFLSLLTLTLASNPSRSLGSSNSNCLLVTLQDSFGDGWENGTSFFYTYDLVDGLNSTNSLTLSSCPDATYTTCLPNPEGSYYLHLTLKSFKNGVEFTPSFFWEMQYSVQLLNEVGETSAIYYGGYNTSMVFKYTPTEHYRLEWWENMWTNPEEENICEDNFSVDNTCSQFLVTTNLINSTNSGNYENAGWFISSAEDTTDLIDYGIPWSDAVTSNSSTSHCSVCLTSGDYLFRVTGALYNREDAISWSFCGVEGKGQIEMSFKIIDSVCSPTSIKNLTIICQGENEIITTNQPTSTPTLVPSSYSPTPIPTSFPTNSPTPLPSTTPTFSPSTLPTIQPTAPTASPTLTPTRAPTSFPSSRPSFNPTTIYDTLKATERTIACYSDCKYPGSPPVEEWTEEDYCAFYTQSTTCSLSTIKSYSCVPTCLKDCSDVFCDSMSTLVYSCDPNVHATYRNKTVVESSCLASYSSTAETKTLMTFTTDSTFDGVSPTEMQNDQNAQDAAIVAMSMSISGVPADQISIESITGSDSRRNLGFSLSTTRSNLKGSARSNAHHNEKIEFQTAQAVVNYKITATLEALGFSESTSDLAYQQLTNQISSSVATGQFQQNLKAAGTTKGLTTFQNAEVTKQPTYTAPQVTVLISAPPTSQPTSQPTSHHKKSDSKTDIAPIVGGVIGGFFGLLLIGALIYYLIKESQRHTLEVKFLEHSVAATRVTTPVTNNNPYANDNPLQNDDEVQVSFAYDTNNQTDLSNAGYQKPTQVVRQGQTKGDQRDGDTFL